MTSAFSRVALVVATVLAVIVSLTGPSAAVSAPTGKGVSAGRACEDLTSLQLENTVIRSAQVNSTGSAEGPLGTVTGLPEYCAVKLTVTHPPAGDAVNVEVWLPTTTWNGRFQGTGGGGWSGGAFANNLGPPVKRGYAAASTDTGHPDPAWNATPSWYLSHNGDQLLRDFAYQGIHAMTVAGKAVTAAFYGKAAHHSYYLGCSTGGRQGMAEAQRYPHDYDGIVAEAPVVNWTRFIPAQMWPQLVMNQMNNFVPMCKLDAANAAAVAACDGIDRIQDGVIDDPRKCEYDPAPLVGTSTPCGQFTEADAAVVRAIWQGPRRHNGDFMWHGLERGAPYTAIANTVVENGKLTGSPFPIAHDWMRYFLLKDPSWDWKTMTYAQFERLFDQSVAQFSSVIATDNPDLRPFQRAGGKLLVWHPYNDDGVFPRGMIDYWERVERVVGKSLPTFARLFMAPGANHCVGPQGAGPHPVDPLAALVRWVEKGKAPDRLEAAKLNPDGSVLRTRPLCPYPKVARHTGRGSTDESRNFVCRHPARR